MKLNQVLMAIATIKKGTITKVHYQTIKGDYAKETETLVRFVKYGNIKGVQVAGKTSPNESKVNGSEFIIYNQKTNKHYLQMATTNTKAKAKVKYYYKGQEIDKATYEMANPSKPNTQPLVVFRKDINDIISIG